MEDKLYTSIRFHASLALIFIVATFVVLLMVIKTPNLLTTLFLLGSCGGIVATFQRIKNVPADSHHFENPISNNLAILQVYTSPLVAGIFSLVQKSRGSANLIRHVNGEFKLKWRNTLCYYALTPLWPGL